MHRTFRPPDRFASQPVLPLSAPTCCTAQLHRGPLSKSSRSPFYPVNSLSAQQLAPSHPLHPSPTPSRANASEHQDWSRGACRWWEGVAEGKKKRRGTLVPLSLSLSICSWVHACHKNKSSLAEGAIQSSSALPVPLPPLPPNSRCVPQWLVQTAQPMAHRDKRAFFSLLAVRFSAAS